jgi:acyl-CoA synthetase (NDP forming)
VQELPETVDLVVVCVPGDRVLAAAHDALGAGVRALCVISAGSPKSAPRVPNNRNNCSSSCARTARGSSGRIASALRSRRSG